MSLLRKQTEQDRGVCWMDNIGDNQGKGKTGGRSELIIVLLTVPK